MVYDINSMEQYSVFEGGGIDLAAMCGGDSQCNTFIQSGGDIEYDNIDKYKAGVDENLDIMKDQKEIKNGIGY